MDEKTRHATIKAVNSQMWINFKFWIEDQEKVNYENMISCPQEDLPLYQGKGKLLKTLSNLREDMNRTNDAK